MPNLDDELRRWMQRAGRRVDTDGLEGRLHERRARKQITQKVGRGFLAVTVVAGSAVGVAGLNRAFRGDGLREQPAGVAGTIAYMRMLRRCEPGIDRPSTQVVAVDVATGDVRVVRSTPFFTDSARPKAERAPEFSPDGSKMAWADRYGYDLEVTDVVSGQTEQLTHGLSVGAPHWSPDGTKLLFAAGEKSDDPSGQSDFLEGPDAVYTMNADGSDLTKLIDGTLPIWSPDGRIAFLRTQGDPAEPGPLGPTSFYVMSGDGTGIEKVYEGPADVPIRDAEWSPDGNRIAAEATLRGNTDIFVVDLTLRTAIRLTDDPRQDTSPTWSPDGTMIAFQTGRWSGGSNPGQTGHSEIAVMNADGSDVRRITADCVDDYEPTWIANDAVVRTLPVAGVSARADLGDPHIPDPGDILVDGQVGNFSDLFALDPETGTLTNLTADFAAQATPAWSPDHSQIAFTGDVDEPGNYDIYVMNADGSNLQRLTTDPYADFRPSWAPDSSAISFEGAGSAIWSVAVDGSGVHRVSPRDIPSANYSSWSPDGAAIAYAGGDGIYITHLADGATTKLYGNDGRYPGYEVEWSPDGSKLLFTCGRDVCVMDADGGNLVNLTEQPGADTYEREADWSPDGMRIVFMSDRGSNYQPYVMNADGTGITPLGEPQDGCCHEPDW